MRAPGTDGRADKRFALPGRYSSEIRTGCANERSSGSVRGCALKAHGVQFPEMETAAKPSSQPRTETA